MDRTQVQVSYVFGRGLAIQLPVEGVACLIDHGVARIDLHYRLYVLVPAIVTRPRLLAERLERIYADNVLSRHPFPPRSLRRIAFPALMLLQESAPCYPLGASTATEIPTPPSSRLYRRASAIAELSWFF